jgi:hypothetical protein
VVQAGGGDRPAILVVSWPGCLGALAGRTGRGTVSWLQTERLLGEQNNPREQRTRADRGNGLLQAIARRFRV